MLPSSTDLGTLAWAFEGRPFVQVVSKSSIVTTPLEYAFNALPFSGASTGNIDFNEFLIITDTLSAQTPDTTLDIIDSFAFNILLSFDETISITDSVTAIARTVEPFNFKYSTVAQISEPIDDLFGVQALLANYFNQKASIQATVIEDYLLPTTNVTSPGNIFQPTIIVNGSYIVQNAATDPGGDISKTSLYIDIKNAGLTNITPCDLEGFGFTLDFTGGNYSLISTVPMGNLGDIVDIYGFKGTITTAGQIISNSQAGYTYKGIFGAPKLNRFFEYIMSSNSTILPLLTNPAFYQTNSANWQSARSIAQAIASIAGVNLIWTIFDVVVSDFRLEDTMTGLDALSSMATRAGGQLRWNGNNSYIVAYPDQFFGYWSPSSCTLIGPEGLSNENYLDLTTGLYGLNPSVIADFGQSFNAGVKTLPISTEQGNNSPQVQQIAKVKQRITTDDPALVFDLPIDYDQVYVQILVAANGDFGGSNSVSTSNFVTKDPAQWFSYNFATLGNEYIFTSNVGGAFIPQVKLDSKVFPSPNTSVDNGNFVLTLACTRRQLALTPTNNSQQAATQGLSQEFFRFIKVYSGSFTCVFFGSFPVPGMWASATVPNVRIRIPNNSGGYDTKIIGDITVEGIVESISFAFPGFITVNVAKYKRLQYLEVPRINYGS